MFNKLISPDVPLVQGTNYVVGIASKFVILYEATCIEDAHECITRLPFSDARVCTYTIGEWTTLLS